jgi:hypothetical protein
VVSILASGTQDHRFEPGRSRQIFWAKKSTVCLPSGGEVKLSVPCHRFAACKKTPTIYVEVRIAGKIDRPFLAQFHPSLTEVSRVAWSAVPLEMMGGTKGGAQRASSLRPRCVGEVDPETTTHIYLSIYLSFFLTLWFIHIIQGISLTYLLQVTTLNYSKTVLPRMQCSFSTTIQWN